MAEFVVEYGKTTAPAQSDGRLDAPAFHRNHEAIWSAIGGFLATQSGDLLEIGSGTGQHAAAFAPCAPARGRTSSLPGRGAPLRRPRRPPRRPRGSGA